LKAQYTGTGSVTQGAGAVVTKDLFVCAKGRPTNLGTIMARDGRSWTVPASVNFAEKSFPASHDLHNACSGVMYANTAAARAGLANSSVVTVDADGEMLTAYVFADNYFEMYVNGVPVGKDNVPFTQFNSSVVKFRARRPCTIAILAVDWEENLGLGSESMPGTQYHPGDAGIVITFTDQAGNIIETTSDAWRAQTYYTSPIQDLTCLSEVGNVRSSATCSDADAADGSRFYGVHWERPAGWMNAEFDDALWPRATVYANNVVGVDNKPSYTNYVDLFDDPRFDAKFIWTSNLVLDNEVLLRYRLQGTTSVGISESTRHDSCDEASRIELYGIDGVFVAAVPSAIELDRMLQILPSGTYVRVVRSGDTVCTALLVNVR
jgi:hypothetical protein